jgi:putative pyoverdin transport system ATP-binding/permease protein
VSYLKKLISFLLKCSENPGRAVWAITIILLTGIVAGLASTGLLVLTNKVLFRSQAPVSSLRWNFLGLCILMPLSRFLSQTLLFRLSQRNTFDVRMKLSRAVLQTPLRDLEDIGPARILAAMTDDIQNISVALSNLPVSVLHCAVVLSCIVYMGFLSWKILGFVLMVVVLGIVSYRIPLSFSLRHARLSRLEWDSLFAHLRALTHGTKELKLHQDRQQEFFARHLKPAADSVRHHNVIAGIISAAANSWGQVLFFFLIGAILFILPGLLPVDRRILTGYALSLLYMMTPLDMLLNQIPILARATVAIEKVDSLGLSLADLHRGRDSAWQPSAPATWMKLEMAGISHTFHSETREDEFVLGPLSLTFRPQEIVFIVGGNGSGKTTLAKLILGLYMPQSGEIRLDNQHITEQTIDCYRQMFSAVFSDFFLFETLLGVEDPLVNEKVRHYLATLNLSRKVRVEDGVFSTTDLSQGQRKRLALVTAYMEDRPVYLFDEWAADQDPQFKEIFYYQLLPELRRRGKTLLVITHDDHYFHVADRIIKLEQGQIEYDGPANTSTLFPRAENVYKPIASN